MKTCIVWLHFCFIFISSIIVSDAFAWSSARVAYDFAATHEFMNEEAYKELKEHPAFKYNKFPSLSEIQNHAGVNSDRSGLGPDGSANSNFSYHWYNPLKNTGKAPDVAQDYFNRVLDYEKGEDPAPGKIIKSDPNDNLAHSLAYAAHYVQDMTCSFHVIGMPSSAVDINKPALIDANGPFRIYDKEAWKHVVTKFREAQKKDEKIDWFDATYWDGQELLGDNGSSHFMYEALVEFAYKKQYSNKGFFDVVKAGLRGDFSSLSSTAWVEERKSQGMLSPQWSNTDSEKTRVQALSKRLAKITRDSLDANRNGAKIDTVVFQNSLKIGSTDASFVSFLARVYNDVTTNAVSKTQINVPYDDWWRGIQATYTVWRAAICALCVTDDDIEIVKASNSKDKFQVKVKIRNLEQEDARDVKVTFKLIGSASGKGECSFGSVEGRTYSPSKLFSETFTFKESDRKTTSIVMTITGKYQKSPDSGMYTKTFEMDKIKFKELKMPRFILKRKDQALAIAENDPYKFKVRIESAGEAKTKLDTDIVDQQDPAEGVSVTEGDNVVLKVFGEYKATVPNVIGKHKKEAMGLIIGADLKPAPSTVDVAYDQPEGFVVSQSPSEGSRVDSQSDVTISVSKRLPKPKAEPVTPPEETPEKKDTVVEPPDEEETPLRELVVSPGGATIEVGDSVALTATPIFLFPERTMSRRGIDAMSYQWVSNVPGLASVAGGGRHASVTGIQEGTVVVMCITPQAMGLATIIIKPSTKNKRDNGQKDDKNSGFKDSTDGWDVQEAGDNAVDAGLNNDKTDGWENQAEQDPIVQQPQDQQYYDQPAYDPYADQQQAYQEQLRQQQALNMITGMIGSFTSQIQQMRYENSQPAYTPAPSRPVSPALGTVTSYIEGGGPERYNPPASSAGYSGPIQVRSGGTGSQSVTRSYCPRCSKPLAQCTCGWSAGQ